MSDPAAITCDAIEPDLKAYQDGELEPAQRDRVATHIRGCAVCSHQLDELARLHSTLRALPESDAPLEAAFKTRIMAALPQETRPLTFSEWIHSMVPSGRPSLVFGGVCAAAAVVLLLAPRMRDSMNQQTYASQDATKSTAGIAMAPGAAKSAAAPMAAPLMVPGGGGGGFRSAASGSGTAEVARPMAGSTAQNRAAIATPNADHSAARKAVAKGSAQSSGLDRSYYAHDVTAGMVSIQRMVYQYGATVRSSARHTKPAPGQPDGELIVSAPPAKLHALLDNVLTAAKGALAPAPASNLATNQVANVVAPMNAPSAVMKNKAGEVIVSSHISIYRQP